jgi:hypothetical protein
MLITVPSGSAGKPNLPEGLLDFVATVIEDWDWDELPANDSEVWSALLYPIFLGENVRSAQAHYVEGLLERFLTMAAAETTETDSNWNDPIIAAIDSEMKAIKNTPGEGLKRAMLISTRKSVENYDLSRTAYTALRFFKIHDFGAEKIRQIQGDTEKTLELVDHAAREIHNVRYIKAVLWFYNCGVAQDLAPPNYHSRNFLVECDYQEFGFSRDRLDESREIFVPLCQKMRSVASAVSKELKEPVTAKQVQLSAWYLESCRGLPELQGIRRRLTPKTLLAFLGGRKIGYLSKLSDVEELSDLGEELKRFLNRI